MLFDINKNSGARAGKNLSSLFAFFNVKDLPRLEYSYKMVIISLRALILGGDMLEGMVVILEDKRKVYIQPAIIHEFELETRAGSINPPPGPGSLPGLQVDPLDPGKK